MTVEARRYKGEWRIMVRGTQRLAKYRDGRAIEPQKSGIAARLRAKTINRAIWRKIYATNTATN